MFSFLWSSLSSFEAISSSYYFVPVSWKQDFMHTSEYFKKFLDVLLLIIMQTF